MVEEIVRSLGLLGHAGPVRRRVGRSPKPTARPPVLAIARRSRSYRVVLFHSPEPSPLALLSSGKPTTLSVDRIYLLPFDHSRVATHAISPIIVNTTSSVRLWLSAHTDEQTNTFGTLTALPSNPTHGMTLRSKDKVTLGHCAAAFLVCKAFRCAPGWWLEVPSTGAQVHDFSAPGQPCAA